MPYILRPCTNSEELFQAVLDHSPLPGLQLDFIHSKFQLQPRLLFQNNALGEWFKVRLAQEKGICIGLTIGYSEEILEHYLGLFFPELEPNWVHADLVSLLVFHVLQDSKERSKYLPKALWDLTQQLEAKKYKQDKQGPQSYRDDFASAVEQHLWNFAQEVAQLFLSYDQYRRELQEVLNPNNQEKPEQQQDRQSSEEIGETKIQAEAKAEAWQQNLWHRVQQYQGFHWRGQSIEKILNEKLCPHRVETEPLYIIGSGFISAQQQAFYSYLSQFTQVYHFWLTPTEFPLQLCQQAAQMFWGQSPYSEQELSEAMGGLPQALWLENNLHSAALLHHIPDVTWQPYPQQENHSQKDPPSSLLELVQRRLRYCIQKQDEPQSDCKPTELPSSDDSIRYFACSDKRREVETLKDQILASLDANPDWQLNDVAVLAPDINDYQVLIQSVFQQSGVALNCNFIDLNSSNSLLSPYFSAFHMLLSFRRFTMLDEWLKFLENPCARVNELVQTKPQHFWLKILRYWQFSLGGDNPAADIWQTARERLLHDYLHDYGGNNHAPLNQQLSLDQSEAMLLAELLDHILGLQKELQKLNNKNRTITEWVSLLEGLQDRFLCCHKKIHHNHRDIINRTLRNFLNIEKSLHKGQSNPSAEKEEKPLSVPFSVIQNLLQHKFEQNFSFKGRYLTQGITCASLQPYRSVPFRMICVLGFDEKSFPRSSTPLRFDLCSSLPQHLSRQAQEQHIFAELLISARERLLLFYPNRDREKGNEQSPSASLYELAYFIAKITGQAEEEVWQQLLQVQPLFPFERCYFDSAEFFSYSHSHYLEFLALQDSYKPSKSVYPEPKELALWLEQESNSRLKDFLFNCDLQEIMAVLGDAPAYFWQRYSGLSPYTYQTELPFSEQLSPSANMYGRPKNLGMQLAYASLEPLKYAKWQQQLWREPEFLLAALQLDGQLGGPDLRSFLQREGALGSPLFCEQQWQSLKQGRDLLNKQLGGVEHWPGWEAICGMRQYSLSLLASGTSGRTLRSERAAKGSNTISRYGAFLLPALAVELTDGAFALLEAHIPRLWLTGQRIIGWNQSPFGVPPKLYSLLQHKLFVSLRQFPLLNGYTELLQLEWPYSTNPQELFVAEHRLELDQAIPTLRDYIWLVAQARCGALPLSLGFLDFIPKRGTFNQQLSHFKEDYQEICQAGTNPTIANNTEAIEPLVKELQQGLYQLWHGYIQSLDQQQKQTDEALTYLAIDFNSKPLQQPRFWLLFHELLSIK